MDNQTQDQSQSQNFEPNQPNQNSIPMVAIEQPKKNYKKLYAIVGAVIVVVVLGFGYYVYSSPKIIWKHFISQPSSKATAIVDQDINFNYQDNRELSSTDLEGLSFRELLSKLKFGLSGRIYTNSLDPENLESSGEVSYNFGSGDTSFSAKFGVVMKDKNFYLKVGNIPMISSLISLVSPDKKVDWVKVDLNALSEFSNQNKKSFNPDTKDQALKVQEIVNAHFAKIYGQGQAVGRETILGTKTMHYKNTLNKEEFKVMIKEIVNYMFEQAAKNTTSSPENLQKNISDASEIINILVDKMQIKSLDTWVGRQDYLLYKFKLQTSAPSIASLISEIQKVDKNKEQKSEVETAKEILSNVAFDGEFSFSTQVYSYGKNQTVTEPSNALDLVQTFKEQKQKQEQTFQDINSLESNPSMPKKGK